MSSAPSPSLDEAVARIVSPAGWWVQGAWILHADGIERRVDSVVLHGVSGRCARGDTWWITARRLTMTFEPNSALESWRMRARDGVRVADSRGRYGTAPRARSWPSARVLVLSATSDRRATLRGERWRLPATHVTFDLRSHAVEALSIESHRRKDDTRRRDSN